MPLYETVMQEKPPVVLDIGTAYTKLGMAAEAHPRKIIPSQVIRSTTGKKKAIFDYEDRNELYDNLVDFLQTIFFKYLLVSPKDRKIVVVENVFGQTVVRECLARVLFRHFEVSSILFVPNHMIALAPLAIPTGIVIDVGYSETTIMPVFCGVQLMRAFLDQSYGGRLIHKEIERQLRQYGIMSEEQTLPESVLEDIKVRACFVTTLDRAQQYRSSEKEKSMSLSPPPSIEYSIDASHIIMLPGRLRETVFEVLFEENNERDSIPHLILRSILSCPVDVRKELTENIFVIGGSAIIMGLLPRLKEELRHLLLHDREYKEKFHCETKFKFHKTIGRENFTAWLGASLCGGTDLIQTRALTKEAYVRIDRVPDWINLTDNRLAG